MKINRTNIINTEMCRRLRKLLGEILASLNLHTHPEEILYSLIIRRKEVIEILQDETIELI